MIVEVDITPEQVEKARTLAEDLGKLKNSITKGDGNVAGFLGEVVVAELMDAKHANTYDYDLILPNGKTVDVKTKRTGFEPRGHYDCSVSAFNTRQACDYYAFVRVKNDLSVAWVLGFYEKARYFKDARFYKKGDYDPDNRFTFKADSYNIKISELMETP